MKTQALCAFAFLISTISALNIPWVFEFLNTPSTLAFKNDTERVWPPIPYTRALHDPKISITITNCWPQRDSSVAFRQAVFEDIKNITDTKFPAGEGRDDEPVLEVGSQWVGAVEFHLQSMRYGESITLAEARELMETVGSMMRRYGPAIAYGEYKRDDVARVSFSFLVQHESSRASSEA